MIGKLKFRGNNFEVRATPIEMPWGVTYWLIEASLERPVLPQTFRRLGEPTWNAIEPTLDAAQTKIQEYVEFDFANV